jgi:nucleoside-diphosphate-sugar epimerase
MAKYDVVLTGSDGYIGTYVKNALSTMGLSVLCVDLKSGLHMADVMGVSAKWLIHLAALIDVRESHDKNHAYFDNNCGAYYDLVMKNGNTFENIIYASSAAVYDDHGNINPQSVYGMTKLNGEYITKMASPTNHLVLRFANPVGVSPVSTPKMGDGLFFKLAQAAVDEKVFSIHNSEHMKRDFFPVIWIPLLISAVIKDENFSMFGTHDLCSGKLVTVRSVVEALCDLHEIGYKLVAPPIGTLENVEERDCPILNQYLDIVYRGYDPVAFVTEQFPNYLKLAAKIAIKSSV